MKKILVINTGSTSTKIAVFEDDRQIYSYNLNHSSEELNKYSGLNEQYMFRKETVLKQLCDEGIETNNFSAVAARGGTFGYAQGGAYIVEKNLINACLNPITNHPSNFSAVIAADIAKLSGCNAYIYDAVCVNEVVDIARITGVEGIKRRPFSHVLNTRAVARELSAKYNKPYEEMNIIVAHLGGGISVNVHNHGKIVDLVSDDEGSMSPERAGRLNGKAMVELCFNGKLKKEDIMKLMRGAGGLVSLLGTSDIREIEQRISRGDEKAAFILDSMSYQLAKDISSLAAVVNGNVDFIAITGGAAHSRRIVDNIKQRVSYLAPVHVVPGSMEMEALASGICRVLDGKEQAKVYTRD